MNNITENTITTKAINEEENTMNESTIIENTSAEEALEMLDEVLAEELDEVLAEQVEEELAAEPTFHALLIDPIHGAKEVDIPKDNTLGALYDLIGCELVDVAVRRVGRKNEYLDFIVDDEGLMVGDPICSATTHTGKPMLVGNIVICSHDDEGGFASIGKGTIARILSHLLTINQLIKEDGELKVVERYRLTDVQY